MGVVLLGLALGRAFLMPEVFYPDLPFPRGPHLSEMIGLGSAGCFMLALHRWHGRHMARKGWMSFDKAMWPVDGWAQWAYHVDPFGKVIDD